MAPSPTKLKTYFVVMWKHRRDLTTHKSDFLLRDLVDCPRAWIEGVVGRVFGGELPLPRLEGTLLGSVRGQHLLVDWHTVPSDAHQELQVEHRTNLQTDDAMLHVQHQLR